jgi:glycosyltransferase involved in cell wall biosynthesis
VSLLVINWPLSSFTGYGIYGLQILMQHVRRGGRFFVLTDKVIQPILLPPPFDSLIAPLLDQACDAARVLDQKSDEILRFDAPVLHGLGSNFSVFKNSLRVKGRPNVGCAALEELSQPADWLDYLKIFDMFIAISRWNATFLNNLNMAPTYLCHQGIETSVFHPPLVPRKKNNRFVVFSGGKFEFRKGQDIVLAAFKIFHNRHDDALLIASWQNLHEADPTDVLSRGLCKSVPAKAADGRGLDITQWLQSEGLPEDSFKALPFVSSSDTANILRCCDPRRPHQNVPPVAGSKRTRQTAARLLIS